MGDVDGSYITSLLCTFFAKHMPDVILEERLYKAVSPLYHLSDKKKSYYKKYEVLYDKHEYYNLFNHIAADNVGMRLLRPDNISHELSKKEKLNWLEANINYLYHLNNLSRRVAAPPAIVEKVCWNLLLANGSEVKFQRLIQKEFPEMIYSRENQSLVGSSKGEFISLIIDSLFAKISAKFMGILAGNEAFYLEMKNLNEKNGEWELTTISGFLNAIDSKYGIDIDQRFKGVGEVDTELLFRTVINPKLRKLYKLTVSDVETALETIEILHGKRSSEYRKELITDHDYTLEDIDN